jgi:hypothetical protein
MNTQDFAIIALALCTVIATTRPAWRHCDVPCVLGMEA